MVSAEAHPFDAGADPGAEFDDIQAVAMGHGSIAPLAAEAVNGFAGGDPNSRNVEVSASETAAA